MFGLAAWKSVTSCASAVWASGLEPGSRPTTLSVTFVFGSSEVELLVSPAVSSLDEHATSVLLSASAPAMANATVVREYFIVAPCWGVVGIRARHRPRKGGGGASNLEPLRTDVRPVVDRWVLLGALLIGFRRIASGFRPGVGKRLGSRPTRSPWAVAKF